jgi:hypothetical protein
MDCKLRGKIKMDLPFTSSDRGIESSLEDLADQASATLSETAAAAATARRVLESAPSVISATQSFMASAGEASTEATATFKMSRSALKKIDSILPELRQELKETTTALQDIARQGQATLDLLNKTLKAIRNVFLLAGFVLLVILARRGWLMFSTSREW